MYCFRIIPANFAETRIGGGAHQKYCGGRILAQLMPSFCSQEEPSALYRISWQAHNHIVCKELRAQSKVPGPTNWRHTEFPWLCPCQWPLDMLPAFCISDLPGSRSRSFYYKLDCMTTSAGECIH